MSDSLHIPEHLSGRLDKLVADLCPQVSRSRLKNLILEGHLSVDGTVVLDPSAKLKGGEEIDLTIPPAEQGEPQPENIPLDIVYEDDDIIVINKQAGLVVHPAPGNWQGTLVNALLYHCGSTLSGIGGVKRPGIVHRLDKETSGLMVVAKNDKAHTHLTKQFATRSLSRNYRAFVWSLPKKMSDTIETFIGRSRTNRKKMAVLTETGKIAITDYQVKHAFHMLASIVECTLQTGRTHQIRVHMAHIGHPVMGDAIYGRRPKSVSTEIEKNIRQHLSQDRHLLHAFAIKFIHPVKKTEMSFKVDDPQDFKDIEDYLSSIQSKI